jgi:hypothetical protein
MQRSDSIIPRIDRMLWIAVMIAIIGIAFTSLLYVLNPARFFPSYLIAFLYWTDITLGCLGFLLLVQLVQGNWGIAIERIAAAGARTIPLIALFFLPLLFWMEELYLWTTSSEYQSIHAEQPLPYLTVSFWVVRAIVAFLIWIGLAYGVSQWSYGRDRTSAQQWGYGLARLAAFGMILFVITTSYTTFDWSMSLDPYWFSSVYGWLAIARQGMAAMALCIIVLALIGRTSILREILAQRVIDDLATILLATVMLWGYMSFFQFLIMWNGNLPYNVSWYILRQSGGWEAVTIFLVIFHLVLPFFLLIIPVAQRTLGWIAAIAGLLMVMHLVEVNWLVMPVFSPSPSISWLDIVLPVTLGAIWLLVFLWSLRSYRLVSPGRSQQSLAAQQTQEQKRLVA